MEIVGGILVGVVVLTILAAIGVTTLVAFGLMALLGLVSEMSFKRIFFASFMMALAAPLMLGIAGFAMMKDGSLERGIRDGIDAKAVFPENGIGEWRETMPRIRDLRDELRDGRINRDEFERELEQIIDEATNVQIEIDGVDAIVTDEVVQIDAN